MNRISLAATLFTVPARGAGDGRRSGCHDHDDDHRFARITGAPALHDGRLYVPVSSIEESAGGVVTIPINVTY